MKGYPTFVTRVEEWIITPCIAKIFLSMKINWKGKKIEFMVSDFELKCQNAARFGKLLMRNRRGQIKRRNLLSRH